MARKLRKGRDQCTGTRRDGKPCEAPAVAGALVCLKHGGSAPQVQIAAAHWQLQLRRYATGQEWLESRGTKAEDAALSRYGNAQALLHHYEQRMAYLARLRHLAELRRAAAS